MGNFQYFRSTLMALLCVSCTWVSQASATFAGNEQIGMDANGTLAAIWKDHDAVTSHHKIEGTVGNSSPWTIIDITDPTLFGVYNPVLAIAAGPVNGDAGGSRAAAAWLAHDLTTGNYVIQATYLPFGSGNWFATPNPATQTISLNPPIGPAEEIPYPDYRIVISDDGTTIVVTWVAVVMSDGATHVRINTSTDGGVTWAGPQTLSPL